MTAAITEERAAAPHPRCTTCGGPMVNADMYSVCPRGHGGLFPKLPEILSIRNWREATMGRTITEAQPLDVLSASSAEETYANRTIYTICGSPGLWRRVARTGSGLEVNREGGELAILNGNTLAEFVRDAALEAALRLALDPQPPQTPPATPPAPAVPN